jgi:hypothetical protein
MHELLSQILSERVGIDRSNKYEKAKASIVSGGDFFPLRGVIQRLSTSKSLRSARSQRSVRSSKARCQNTTEI